MELMIDAVSAIEQAAYDSLIWEVHVTPKPGLVDQNNSGAHHDMDLSTFLRSAGALRSYFGECARTGYGPGFDAASMFPKLRALGIRAEQSMLEATGGVNTHKGAVFLLGILCAAAASCRYEARPDALREKVSLLGRIPLQELLALSDAGKAVTGGQKQFLQYGFTGIRGEVADGLPSVWDRSLPAMESAIASGLSFNDACVRALLCLMSCVDDSNVLRRGGLEKLRQMQQQALDIERRGFDPQQIIAFDDWMIRNNLSPGGCADLLAATIFLCPACPK